MNPPTDPPIHPYICMYYKHDNFMKMAAPWGNPWEFLMMSYVHACAHHHPLTQPSAPPPPMGVPRESVKIE